MRELNVRDKLGRYHLYNAELGSGILDKHGNEIFEGDVVRVPGYDHKREVVWTNGGLYLRSVESEALMGIMPGCVIVENEHV